MNIFKTILLLSLVGSLLFVGCKEDPVLPIEYPITLSYQNYTNDSGVRAYEIQNGELTEIDASSYESNPYFDISSFKNLDKFVLSSESSGELHLGTTIIEATYIINNEAYKFSYDDPNSETFASHTAKGNETKLSSTSVILLLERTTDDFTASGLCGEAAGENILPCAPIDDIINEHGPQLMEGEKLIIRTFDSIYE